MVHQANFFRQQAEQRTKAMGTANPKRIGTDFGQQLQSWRKRRRCTQMELAFISGYSQRHLSFLESGRSQPSRETIGTLSEALEVPVGIRNELYLAAGFAPVYTQEPMDSQLLEPTMASMQELLVIHRPFPAILIDRAWNMYAANPNAIALFTHFTHDPSAFAQATKVNTLRSCIDPAGMRPYIVNWREFMTRLMGNVRREIANDGRDPELHELMREAEAALASDDTTKPVVPTHTTPVTHLVLQRDDVRLELAALMSYFDSPFDATIAGLRIETFMPANEPTRAFLDELDKSLT